MSFDAQLSMELKERGMKKAAISRKELLTIARESAIVLGKAFSICTSDDIAREMDVWGYDYAALGNAAGSIFATDCWVFDGARIKSKRTSAHAREIKVWRYIGG